MDPEQAPWIAKTTSCTATEIVTSLSLSGLTGQSTLRQAQGDNCHGELVEPWIPRSGLSSDPPIKLEDRPDQGVGE